MNSISEKHGIELVTYNDLNIYSIGISTAGEAEIEMLKKNPKTRVIATTIDEQGMKYTRKVIEGKKLSERIELKIEDISEDLPYDDETFDYIYARLVLHYLENDKLEKALKEIYRVLKTHGKLYVVVRGYDWETSGEDVSFDLKTGMTKYPIWDELKNKKYCYRRLHTEESIRSYLESTKFQICYIKSYFEILSKDYSRKNMNVKPSKVIEVLSLK